MYSHRQYRLKLTALALLQFFLAYVANAQTAEPANARVVFGHIDPNPHTIRVKNNNLQIPAGGHLQGIQSISDSEVIITASSGSYAYYITAFINRKNGTGKIESLQKITDKPYRHAGGCQVYNHNLVVGVEDNIAKNKSEIMMISLNDSGQKTGQQIIASRHGAIKRSTAGAVGFTKTKTGRYLVVVGDWDSDYFDVYISRPGNDSQFDSLTTFHAPETNHLPSYQGINLLCDTAGQVYMVGFSLYKGHNRAELIRLDIEQNSIKPVFIRTCDFHCRGGAGFRYGSGISMGYNGQPFIYTCGRKTKLFTSINIFDKARTATPDNTK